MFEKREVRSFAGARREVLWPEAWNWWHRQGFVVTQTGSFRVHGSSRHAPIGLRREFDLAMDETPDGCNVDLAVRAELTDEGLIVGAVTALFVLPVAVLGGAVSYTEYEDDARKLMLSFWHLLEGRAAKAETPFARRVSTRCKGCGSILQADWNVCPFCGRFRDQ